MKRTVLITGGSGGIGRAAVDLFLKQGYEVINVDITPMAKNDEKYHMCTVDLADTSALYVALAEMPHVDVLINNATAPGFGDFLTMTEADLRQALDVNVIGHVMLAQWFARQFNGEHGRIINVISTRAFMSEANTIPYTISKGALASLTHGLAATLKDQRITVNAIAPGWIHTGDEPLRKIDHAFHLSGRVGKPHDIARAMLWLADETSEFINGDVITIDGGVTKTMIYPE